MGYDMYLVETREYFRLNIWGMGKALDAMHELGMLNSVGPGGWGLPWPRETDYGLPEDFPVWDYDDESVPETLSPELRAALERYKAALDEHRRAGNMDAPGIPVHKFSSNDGWIVTPIECASALTIYNRVDPDDAAKVLAVTGWDADESRQTWDDWIAYLRRAVDAGGIQVW